MPGGCLARSLIFIFMALAVVAGQDDVVFKVAYDGNSSTTSNYYNVSFSATYFQSLYECLCQGTYMNCTAHYNLTTSPNVVVSNVSSERQEFPSKAQSYYICKNSKSLTSLVCQRVERLNYPAVSFSILNTLACSSACVTVILPSYSDTLTLNNEPVGYTNCDLTCNCPFPTTTNITGFNSTETTAGIQNEEEETPIAIIIGVVIAVILVTVVIVIVVVVVLYRRKSKAVFKAQDFTNTAVQSGDPKTSSRSIEVSNLNNMNAITFLPNHHIRNRDSNATGDYEDIDDEDIGAKYNRKPVSVITVKKQSDSGETEAKLGKYDGDSLRPNISHDKNKEYDSADVTWDSESNNKWRFSDNYGYSSVDDENISRRSIKKRQGKPSGSELGGQGHKNGGNQGSISQQRYTAHPYESIEIKV